MLCSPSLPDQLLAIPTWPSDLARLGHTPKDVERGIKKAEDFLVDDIVGLSFAHEQYEVLTAYIGCYSSLDAAIKVKLLNAVLGGLVKAAKTMHLARPTMTAEGLESLAILSYAVISAAEKEREHEHDKPAMSTGKKGSKAHAVDWNHLKTSAAEAIRSLVTAAALPKLYQTLAELDHLVGLLVKTAHLLVENAENCKIGPLRSACLEALAVSGSKLAYKHGLQIMITQDLSYLDHLAEFNAELLAKMSLDYHDSSILDSTLQHLGGISFSADDSAASKIICAFLIKLTIVDTRSVLRNVSSIAELVDSDVYSVRMSMLEVFAVFYCHLMLHSDRDEQTKAQAKFFLGAIEERLRDINAFVRSKVLLVLGELVQANALPVTERSRLIDLVVGRVVDKSSNVRRRAIQTLGEFLRKHPFCVDGGELSLAFFQERLDDISQQLDQIEPSEVKRSMSGSLDALVQDTPDRQHARDHEQGQEQGQEPDHSQDNAPTELEIQKLQTLLMQKRYYSDAIIFVKQLDKVVPSLCQLLSSTTKTEVFEVMDFFVDAYIYKLQASERGIRKMMHLIWEQDLSTEDGTKRSVKEHVLVNYKRVYLEVDNRTVGRERVLEVARNLLSLVKGSSTSDLASLEQVIAGFMRKDWISEPTIRALAAIFATKGFGLADQRAAIILLAMIGRHSPKAITSRLEIIVKVGLGAVGLSDPWIAEYSLIALTLVASEKAPQGLRLPNDNILFSRILNLIRIVPASARWLQVIAQAIKAIYQLADQPNLLTTALIKELVGEVGNGEMGMVDTGAMVRLLFIIGHVLVATNGHLEDVEKEWKRRQSPQSPSKSSSDSMEGVTATEGDEITEVMRLLRENELLYGDQSLMAVFGPLIVSICSNLNAYPQPLLQNVAVMTLAKFMTVSSRFCDEQLPLFLTILEKCPDATIRSNLAIAFADLAQAFGRIVDSNIVYLFRRLRDPDVQVKRNALLVLTHLTLTGLIKIKGQTGEIAKCILDPDARVAGLARLFFHEMAGRNNAIYNHIPDIISSLSLSSDPAEDGAEELGEQDFGTIAKFIFDYIKKERQMEGLVDKLTLRFRQTGTLRQARDLACCLTFVNYTSERTVHRLVEALPLYKDKLVDGVVFGHFVEILHKMRKGCKDKVKVLLDEFEHKLIQSAGAETPMDIASDKDKEKTMAMAKAREREKTADPPVKKVSATSRKKAPTRASRRIVMRDDSDDNAEEDDDDIF